MEDKRIDDIIRDAIKRETEKVDVNPTDNQKRAGNYRMGHINVHGYKITIENPKGSARRWRTDDGKEGKTIMKHDYGYFSQTTGKDGDHIDVFIGDNYSSRMVFVVDQKTGGKFDESKVMLCFKDKESAKKGYLANYEPGWKGLWRITEVSEKTFKKWLYDGCKQRKPFFQYVDVKGDKPDRVDESVNCRTMLTENQYSTRQGRHAIAYMKKNGITDPSEQEKVIDSIMNDLEIHNTKDQRFNFLLGATRLYVEKQLSSIGDIQNLKMVLKYVSDEGHAGQYDEDLNGLSLSELTARQIHRTRLGQYR